MVSYVRGTPIQITPPSYTGYFDVAPRTGPRHRATVGSYGGVVSHVRGTPIQISPSSYTGYFDAGEEVEAWASRKISKVRQQLALSDSS